MTFGLRFASFHAAMGRKNRSDILYDGCVVHARLQMNNGEFHFSSSRHFKLWRRITLNYLKKYPTIRLTGYIWMSNHCHMTLEADKATDLSRFMHDMSWRFSFEFNKIHGRKGHLFQQRFRCSIIDTDEYEMTVKRYIYRNQIRAGMVKHVGKSKWSSYAYYAQGKPDALITPFRTYASFGLTPKKRMVEFRLFVESMTPREEELWKMKLVHPILKTSDETSWKFLKESWDG